MDLEYSGQTALVTGASQGIGRAIAEGLAGQGVRVAMAARRTDVLADVAHAVRERGAPEPVVLGTDLYAHDAATDLARRAVDALGRVDILVNAAGGSRPLAGEGTREQWDESLTLNFLRIRELTHELLPGMRQRQWGRIVTLTGTSEPRVLNAAFPAKAATHMWSKSLSREVAADGVTVHCVQPGRIRSEQMSQRYPTVEAELAFARDEIPMGRFGEPHELAALVLFLASPLSAYMTGTVIPVDGGMYRFAF